MDRGWTAYYSESTNTVLASHDGYWREHKVFEKLRQEWKRCDHHATRSEEEVQLLTGKMPLEGWVDDDGYVAVCKPTSNWNEWNGNARDSDTEKTWKQYKASLPECDREILKNCKEIVRPGKPNLAEILQSENRVINVCSDGGHCNNRGSYGWVMAVAGTVIWEGKGHARGHPMSLYRAEAYGKLAWMIFLNHYSKFHSIEIQCAVRSYCDNQEVIKQTMFYSRMDKIWDCLRADYDILLEIVSVQDSLRTRARNMIPGQWVKGHQDKVALDKLPLPAILNIAADKLASEALMSITTYHKPLPTLPWTQCRALLYVDGQPYTRAETFQLRWKWRESEYQKYLDGRWGLKKGVIQTINWAGYRLVCNRMTLPM
jgi:hypothetical protein